MPTRLIPEVEEVSLVTKGAGKDCRVLITKRDDDTLATDVGALAVAAGVAPARLAKAIKTLSKQKSGTVNVAPRFHRETLQSKREEFPMSDESGMGVVSVAKRSAQALDDGTISQEAYAKLQQRLAQEQFPNDSMGVALAKFFATPHGAEMLNRGLKKSYEDTQRRTALANADIVEKSNKPRVEPASNEDVAVPDADDDPDEELAKIGELYRRGHPAAKFSREAAIAYAAEHDERGRGLLAQSKRKQMSKLYGEKYAEVFKLGSDTNAPRPKPFRVFTADAAPDVRTDPRNREQLDAGQARVDAGHGDGRDFHERVKRLMNEEGLSRDAAIGRVGSEDLRSARGW
jgi:hypothetical protein